MSSNHRMRRAAGPAAVVVLLASLVLACGDAGTAPASDPRGSIAGTVTLLGPGGPSDPAAREISLYASAEDLESRTAAYVATLHRVPGAARAYDFAFHDVSPGAYYVRACFEFGCGEYRDPGTGALLRVVVQGGRVTRFPFGL